MLNHPSRLELNTIDFLSEEKQKGHDGNIDVLILDESQDNSIAGALLMLRLFGLKTVFCLVGDGKQRIFSFANADPRSIEILCDPESYSIELLGRITFCSFELHNNYRSVTKICSMIETVLRNDCNCQRPFIRTISEEGILLHDQTLGDLSELNSFLREGSVAILCRLTLVVVALLHVRSSKR